MRCLAGNKSSLYKFIDEDYGPEASIVCRYRNALMLDERAEYDDSLKRYLTQCSIREGARIVPLCTHGRVSIHVLDETSEMATGSLKSIDGCVTAAFCRAEGAGAIAFESGGNTGSALTLYGRKAGLETFFFCPGENVDLLDGRMFDDRRAHLIAVDRRERVKDLARLFSEKAGIRHVPDKPWRYAAGMVRGLFILEQMLAAGAGRFDWIAQAVSAAFGPIGIYRALSCFMEELHGLPSFLGVQQEENCPVYRAWRTGAAGMPGAARRGKGRLLSRIMYDESPGSHETYPDLHRILVQTRGDVMTVNEDEFDARLGTFAEHGPILELLRSRGIAIELQSGRVRDKTGLMALAGTMKAIDSGVIPAGASVLCALTGGVMAADGLAQPEATVQGVRDVLDYVERIREGR